MNSYETCGTELPKVMGGQRILNGPLAGQDIPKQSQIGEVVSRLDTNISILQELLKKLEQKLSGVLRQEPKSDSDKCLKSSTLVPLAQRLDASSYNVWQATEFVKTLIETIEL